MHAWTQGKSQRAEAGKFGMGWGGDDEDGALRSGLH